MPYHPVKKKIVRRLASNPNPAFCHLPPLLRRIYGARDISRPEELDRSLRQLPPPDLLSGMEAMVDSLAWAIARQRKLLVIGDYDADGATATAVAIFGLRALGLERVDYVVPNRFEYGYGLTPEIVALAAQTKPDLLLTVDNGIASLAGVAAANAKGMQVLITDHHLPGPELPEAQAIVNPNLPGDAFPNKTLAGVGVVFYVLLGLRQRLRADGCFGAAGAPEPNLAQLLDLVALGTVADVVNLDWVNRILVHQGLQRIRAGQAQPGVAALLTAAGRNPGLATAGDLGFFAAPRLNAAGRLEDMSAGIECLLATRFDQALAMAYRLDELNRERKEIEQQMQQDALAYVDRLGDSLAPKAALCLFEEDWHQGVVGLVASRVKDRLHRPVIAFAPAADGAELKGSARSVAGVHIRDALANIAARQPGLIAKYGGHAMAAGLSLARDRYEEFAAAFEAEVHSQLAGMEPGHTLHTDGALRPDEFNLATAELLQHAGPWGQGFPEPLFDGEFELVSSRIVGERHLKVRLKPVTGGETVDSIAFGLDRPDEWLPIRRLRAAYRLEVNDYRETRGLQLRLDYLEAGDG